MQMKMSKTDEQMKKNRKANTLVIKDMSLISSAHYIRYYYTTQASPWVYIKKTTENMLKHKLT